MNAPLNLALSPLDSSRFGIKVMRGTWEAAPDYESAFREIANADAELIIFRVPAGETSIASTLVREGHAVIHADTLVYYGQDLLGGACPSGDFANTRKATAADRDVISKIATGSFVGYRSHYSANPLLPQHLVHSGYVEWALSRIGGEGQGSTTWVVECEDSVVGFATTDFTSTQVEVVLNAVHPDFERRGLYGSLLRRIIHHYSQAGLSRLVISTQVWNYTVQRQWVRAGLQLFKAYDTYHLDRRLAATRLSH